MPSASPSLARGLGHDSMPRGLARCLAFTSHFSKANRPALELWLPSVPTQNVRWPFSSWGLLAWMRVIFSRLKVFSLEAKPTNKSRLFLAGQMRRYPPGRSGLSGLAAVGGVWEVSLCVCVSVCLGCQCPKKPNRNACFVNMLGPPVVPFGGRVPLLK